MRKVTVKTIRELRPLILSGKLDFNLSDCGQFTSLLYKPNGEEGVMYSIPYGFEEEVVVVGYNYKTISETVYELTKELFDEGS
jgi:ABC-type amino acid transport substrate-binding protein